MFNLSLLLVSFYDIILVDINVNVLIPWSSRCCSLISSLEHNDSDEPKLPYDRLNITLIYYFIIFLLIEFYAHSLKIKGNENKLKYRFNRNETQIKSIQMNRRQQMKWRKGNSNCIKWYHCHWFKVADKTTNWLLLNSIQTQMGVNKNVLKSHQKYYKMIVIKLNTNSNGGKIKIYSNHNQVSDHWIRNHFTFCFHCFHS